MRDIILEKRYPHSREEDITDAFMRGYEIGKEQEHRWWSAFCANCKTENCSEKANNCEPQTESLEQFRVGLEYHTDTTHFGKTKGESVTMDTADTPQTDCPKSCPSRDICTKDATDCAWK